MRHEGQATFKLLHSIDRYIGSVEGLDRAEKNNKGRKAR